MQRYGSVRVPIVVLRFPSRAGTSGNIARGIAVTSSQFAEVERNCRNGRESNVANNVDGIYTPKNRHGYWISWTDAQGRRRRRKTSAKTLSQARAARAAELVRVEQAKALGFAPPGQETMSDVAARFLSHQRARLTPKAYTREEGVVNGHLCLFFAGPLASIRRVDVQRYISKRSPEVSAHSVQKELNILKHLLRLAVEWEIVPFNVSQGLKSPRVPAGRVRYLQPGELRAVLEASPEWLRPILALAACTGMRRSELLGFAGWTWTWPIAASCSLRLRTARGESCI